MGRRRREEQHRLCAELTERAIPAAMIMLVVGSSGRRRVVGIDAKGDGVTQSRPQERDDIGRSWPPLGMVIGKRQQLAEQAERGEQNREPPERRGPSLRPLATPDRHRNSLGLHKGATRRKAIGCQLKASRFKLNAVLIRGIAKVTEERLLAALLNLRLHVSSYVRNSGHICMFVPDAF
jgi:hypothetical protein